MSHAGQLQFLKRVAEANESLLRDASLLEIGSYDVNGSVRPIYSGVGSYVGVDLIPGPGVDIVGFGHELDLPSGSFDMTVSSECFEHDPYWPLTLSNMVRLTRPGGVVTFTCAGKGRPEHGTRRTDPNASPGTQGVGHDYYRNLSQRELEQAFELHALFTEWACYEIGLDVYFAGIVAGECSNGSVAGRLPTADAIEELRRMLGPARRALTLCLRTFDKVMPSPYQSAIVYRRNARDLLASSR